MRKMLFWLVQKALLPLSVGVTLSLGIILLEVPSNDFEMWFFDVGQGDSTLVKTPDNRYILIDGGPDDSILARLSDALPFWHQTIDVVILTHAHADHITGVTDVLAKYKVKLLIANESKYKSPQEERFEARVKQLGIIKQPFVAGDTFTVGDVKITSKWPSVAIQESYPADDENAHAIAFLLQYKDFTVFMPSDTEFGAEVSSELRMAATEVTLLKVPHQGSAKGLTEATLRLFNPQSAVISVGKNTYGHPSDSILSLLRAVKHVYRTDKHGTIIVTCSKTSVCRTIYKGR